MDTPMSRLILWGGTIAFAGLCGCAHIDRARADYHERRADDAARRGDMTKAAKEERKADKAERRAQRDPLP